MIVTAPSTPLFTLTSLLVVTLALELALPLAFVHPIVDIARVAVAVLMAWPRCRFRMGWARKTITFFLRDGRS